MSDKVEPGVVLVNPTGHIINEAGFQISPVSYTHLTLPTSDLV